MIRRAFSLVELLVVLTIVGVLSAVAMPAFNALTGAHDINQSVATLTGTLELARTYAITQHTYVRVAFGQVDSISGGDSDLGVLAISPADGTLAADTPSDMADASKWPAIDRPVVLSNVNLNDSLNAATPSTVADAVPSSSDMGPFTRNVGALNGARFNAFIQFSPSGQARVMRDEVARFIKVGINRARGAADNPFVIRVSGLNGSIHVLRKEDFE